MSHLIRRLVYLFMGILGGIAVWPVMETLLLYQSVFRTYLAFSIASGALFGVVIGAFFGAVDGIVAGNTRRIIEGSLFGAVVGAVGGAFGFVIGQGLLLLIGSAEAIHVTIARTLGWAVLGAFVALAEGTRRRSLRRSVVGLLGGLVGGAIGGLAVEIIPTVLPAAYARPVGLALYGLAVTGAYGIAERRITVGVLRLLNGSYKGKEFILNQRVIEIGSRRRADVYLSDYRNVEEIHASLKEVSGDLIAYPESDGGEVRVNDDAIDVNGSGILKYGDVLKMGTAKMVFRPLMLLFALFIGLGGPIGSGGMPTVSAQSTGDNAAAASSDTTSPSGNGERVSNLRIAEIDTSRLLVEQVVTLYLGITDEDGRTVSGLAPADLLVEEASEEGVLMPLEILSLDEGATEEDGITFFLLIDNSGSMYDRIDSTPTEDLSETRMTAVKEAVRSFLDKVDNSRDKIAIATFNTNYTLLAEATSSLRTIDLLLEEITRPESEDAYTELYRGIAAAANDLAGSKGRRVLLVLSDGENYPFSVHSGEPHPEFGSELVSQDAAIAEIGRYGIGVFGIDFTGSGDPGLAAIARDGGGTVYHAEDGGELGIVYQDIRQRILEEYRLRYRASILPTEYRRVRVSVGATDTIGTIGPSAERRYFAGTIFGVPREDFGPMLFIPLLIAILLAILLSQLRFRNNRTNPNVEIFDAVGKATQILDLTGEKTVIGGAAAADITIAGVPDLKDNHATIVHDPKRNTYTVVATEAITVNNKQTTRRTLEPGDLIELPGATIVFDLPPKKTDTHG